MDKPTNVTSVTLLARIQDSSDGAAWEDFVARYAPQIFSWCQRFRLQDSDAADVTQDVLCKLVQTMRGFRYDADRGRFRGWLKTVTSNAVRDFAAARKRRAAAQGGDETPNWLAQLEDEQATDELADRIESTFRMELLAAAERIVEMRVNPHTWKAYQMTAVQQMSALAAAEELGISVSGIYVAKSRVIKMLRSEVSQIAKNTELESP